MQFLLTIDYWAILGKIAALLGVIWLFIQIFNYFKNNYLSKKQDIIAHGDCFTFKVPKNYKPSIGHELNIESLREELEKICKTKIYATDIRGVIESFVVNVACPKVFDKLNSYMSIWKFQIRNNSKAEISNLFLELSFDGLYLITKSGEESIYSEFKRNINLGSLRPSNQIEVIVWGIYRSDYIKSDDETKITYSNGITNINYPIKVYGLDARLFKKLEKIKSRKYVLP